jgi:hypothetical protein
MTQLGSVPCAELGERVRVAVEEVVAEISEANLDYDEDTADNLYLTFLSAR